ncbi:MAG TPA: NAD(P)-binding protein [Polyangiaceae bacterium]
MSSRLNRRELVGLLLGASLAAGGCRRRTAFPGSVRGASDAVGHRLRGPTVEQARGQPVRSAVAIVGGGPSGLAAAHRLAELDLGDFLIFELERQPGGTSAFGLDGVVPYPWGAHYLPLPSRDNRPLVDLLEAMGALERDEHGEPRAAEHVRVREPEERVFYDGRWYEGLVPLAGATAHDRAELRRFEAVIARHVARRDGAGKRPFALPLRRSSDAAEFAELDRMSAADWLRARGFTSPLLRWYAGYACRDDYGLTLEHTSAWAMLFYFAARIGAPGAASAPFLSWPEGNGRLVRHLAERAGNRLLLGRLVTDIVPRADHVDISVLDVASGKLALYRADHVIFAAPKFVAGRVLRPFRDARPAFLDEFSYGAWLVANLHLCRRPESVGFPFAWDNVLYDSPSVGYVSATHQRLRDRGPTVWTYYLPLTDAGPKQAREALLSATHGELCETVMTDLGRAHSDLEDVIERIDVWRWGHAMIRPVPGFISGQARKRALVPVGRVEFAHSDLSGVALFEEAFDQGIRAAEAVARAKGREFEGQGG